MSILPTDPAKISDIKVSGYDRTKLSFFINELENSSIPSYDPNDDQSSSNIKSRDMNANEVVAALHKNHSKLLETDLFEYVNTRVKFAKNNRNENIVSADIQVKEKGVPQLAASTYIRSVGTSSGSSVGGSLQFSLRNPLGFGEKLTISSSTIQDGSDDLEAKLTIPHVFNNKGSLTVTGKASNENDSYFSSFNKKYKLFSLQFVSRNTKHVTNYDVKLVDEIPIFTASQASLHLQREINNNIINNNNNTSPSDTMNIFDDRIKPMINSVVDLTPRDASPVTLNLLSSHLKTSIKHTSTIFDTRDSAASPNQGFFVQGSVEAALPPGNVSFIKGEVNSQFHHTFYKTPTGLPGLQLSLVHSMGIIAPISNIFSFYKKPYFLPLSDKYQLGGPNSLRGFAIAGVGARTLPSKSPAHQLNREVDEYLPQQFDDRPASAFGFEVFDSYNNINIPTISPSRVTSVINNIPYDEVLARKSRKLDKIKHNITGDSLGGEGKNTFLLLLSVPLPFNLLSDLNSRAFLFFNTGTISTFNYWKNRNLPPDSPTVKYTETQNPSIWGSFRSSIGGGFSTVLGNTVRLEATYSLPITRTPHDVPRNFQFGLSMNLN